MIHVFKTSVDTKSKLEFATALLTELLPHAKWNFDLEDCDNILRIDSKLKSLKKYYKTKFLIVLN